MCLASYWHFICTVYVHCLGPAAVNGEAGIEARSLIPETVHVCLCACVCMSAYMSVYVWVCVTVTQ